MIIELEFLSKKRPSTFVLYSSAVESGSLLDTVVSTHARPSSSLRTKSELIKNFSQELEEFKIRQDRVGYNTKFNELLKKEEDKLNGRKNK
mgnify:CR=1 FL=1